MLAGLQQGDVDHVTAIVRESATSFYHGMKILSRDRRAAMYGIYAFCRLVDDIADDDALPVKQKRTALKTWRKRIAGLYRDEADDAVTRVLRAAAKTYELREADFIAIIDGMEMDGVPIVAPPLPILDLYCDRVAAAVGRLSVRVFGDGSSPAQDVAYALGRALQLTNILRDVKEDAARGRLYLPHEYLEADDVPFDVAGALASPALSHVCAKLAKLAEKNFNEAESSMLLCNRRAMRPARLMAASYRPLLDILRRQNFDYTQGRVSLPKWRKLALAARIFVP
jgi:squalene synthase HpnD